MQSNSAYVIDDSIHQYYYLDQKLGLSVIEIRNALMHSIIAVHDRFIAKRHIQQLSDGSWETPETNDILTTCGLLPRHERHTKIIIAYPDVYCPTQGKYTSSLLGFLTRTVSTQSNLSC